MTRVQLECGNPKIKHPFFDPYISAKILGVI